MIDALARDAEGMHLAIALIGNSHRHTALRLLYPESTTLSEARG
jgi:hypothetical protein